MQTRGSVLVEVLSVLFVLGVFAVVAIPDLGDKPLDPRPATLVAALDDVRSVLNRYRDDHGTYPDLATLKLSERPSHAVNGPALSAYLERIPDNPFTNGNAVSPADALPGTSDWVYDPIGGVFKANDSAAHRAH